MAHPAGPGPYIPSPVPPRPPRRHGALTVFYIGLGLLAVGGIVFGVGLWRITTGLERGIGSDMTTVGPELQVPHEVGVDSTLDVTLTEGTYSIYVEFDALLEPRDGAGAADDGYTIDIDLALSGPDGEPVELEPRAINAGEALFSYQVGHLTAPTRGSYRLTATRLPSPSTQPSVEAVEIRRAGRGDGIEQVLGGGLAMVLGFGAGVVGLLLVVIGGIWWLVARSDPSGGPGAGPPPGGWPPPPGSGAPPGGWAPPPIR